VTARNGVCSDHLAERDHYAVQQRSHDAVAQQQACRAARGQVVRCAEEEARADHAADDEHLAAVSMSL
jgi:hypothetical protein